ncbi:FIST signal transduction protein [Clostridium beijerinckii]|uniref:FIST signal transduction protein n=1 Tax=Clostridium beijerinckii TaxID=1520 RepID=UPI002430DA35|nr:FIST N-terminal domain-containing protein [Clostridium beijerinckii]MDG5855443.1 FIST N-terminal domain-containing protein [Clostridium beijerinckii]
MINLIFSNVQEASRFTNNNTNMGFILFSNVENVVELSKLVSENVILCSTSGEYGKNGYENGIISGFQYELCDGEVIEISYPPIKSINNLKKAYEKIRNNENAFALLLCDGLTGMEESIIGTLYFTDDNFKVIGGSAGDNLKFKETFIFIGEKRVNSAVIFFNIKRRTSIIKENIYIPMGQRLLVTEADPISRTIKTFNKVPASTEYARALNIKESDIPNYFINNPLGKIYEDEIFISSPMKVNADKSITFYSQVMSSTFVEVLKPVDPISQIKDTVRKIGFKPSFILSIHCILRSLKFQQDNIWKAIDKEILSFCPNTTGFVSYGEQFYKKHVNQTMVILAVE